MSDKRLHTRTTLKCRIKIAHESVGEIIVSTQNISDGGVYILSKGEMMPPVGSTVSGQVLGISNDAPVLAMEIVRVEPDGIGLKFVD